jgi:hypothetical protein
VCGTARDAGSVQDYLAVSDAERAADLTFALGDPRYGEQVLADPAQG